MSLTTARFVVLCFFSMVSFADAEERWVFSTAHAIPKHTTSEGSGYFSIVEGKNERIYIGTAKYGHNAYLVEYDPTTQGMSVVVDAQKEIGTDASGFAAQAKFHTRNNVGASGRIYLGTKQGYPKEGEGRLSYAGGYPMVFDPATGTTRVYPIPVPHHGIISVTPDEPRGVAYVSTCSDTRPVESTHFLQLDLEKGTYRDFGDLRHMYAFIVVDWRGRAYHPVLGGEIARFDPQSNRFEQLKQTIDGETPSKDSLLAHAESHPINWDISPDRKTLWAVAMSDNALYSYDLTKPGNTLAGRRVSPLVADAERTDCRALCVGPDGIVWAGVAATLEGRGQLLCLVSHDPRIGETTNHGPVAVRNRNFTAFQGDDGKTLPWHHGYHEIDGQLVPRYVVMGICAARDGTVYLTTLYPFTLHALRPRSNKEPRSEEKPKSVKKPRIAAIVTAYHHNAHADVIVSRLMQTDSLDGKGKKPRLDLVSLYVDQPERGEKGIGIAKKHGVPVVKTVKEALTLGTGELAVDGILLIAEHGNYPRSATGQIIYPKRRLFGEILRVFEASGRVVPVFHDKHIADNWKDASWIWGHVKRLKIPYMAGSSLPTLWRYPPADVERGAQLKALVATSYGSLDAYGFHGLEMTQCLVERRKGGETGIESVQCLSGDAVWKAEAKGTFDSELLDAALGRLRRKTPTREQLGDKVDLFILNYRDGLQVRLLCHNPLGGWGAAWREGEAKEAKSTLFWTQEARPFQHFGFLVDNIEKMMHTGRPTYPAERTLLVSGALDALLLSKREGGRVVKTPELAAISYKSKFDWKEPPPPPKGRPIQSQ